MLKLFFNKESKIVFAMEILGFSSLTFLMITWWPSKKDGMAHLLFYIFIFEYIFIRFFATTRWYGNDGLNIRKPGKLQFTNPFKAGRRYRGIELQFKKAMVPTSYMVALFGILLVAGAPPSILYAADLLLLIIAHVNVILIYFHIRDKEGLPVNYFTHNLHQTP